MRICGKESRGVPSQGETLERSLASREKERDRHYGPTRGLSCLAIPEVWGTLRHLKK